MPTKPANPSRSRSAARLGVELLESRQLLNGTVMGLSPITLSPPEMGRMPAFQGSSSPVSSLSGPGFVSRAGRGGIAGAGDFAAQQYAPSFGGHFGGGADAGWSHRWQGDAALTYHEERFERFANPAGHFHGTAAEDAYWTARGDFRGAASYFDRTGAGARSFRMFVWTLNGSGTGGGEGAAPTPSNRNQEATSPPTADGGAIVPDRAAPLDNSDGQGPTVADALKRLLQERANSLPPEGAFAAAANSPTPLPVREAAADLGGDTRVGRGDVVPVFRPPASGARPGLPYLEQTAGAGKTDTPGPKTPDGTDRAPSPEAAGLLTRGLSAGLALLERAVRAFTEPAAPGAGRGTFLWHWLGVTCWLGACALAYAAARRRSAPAPVFLGTGELGRVLEDLP